jgi:hypothetical protein
MAGLNGYRYDPDPDPGIVPDEGMPGGFTDEC